MNVFILECIFLSIYCYASFIMIIHIIIILYLTYYVKSLDSWGYCTWKMNKCNEIVIVDIKSRIYNHFLYLKGCSIII